MPIEIKLIKVETNVKKLNMNNETPQITKIIITFVSKSIFFIKSHSWLC